MQKDNKVTFWSTIKGLEELVPPEPAKKHIPEWWKKTPPYGEKLEGEEVTIKDKIERSTVKVCPAINDWFLQGYVLRMWCDFHVEIKEDEAWSSNFAFPENYMSPYIEQSNTYIKWLPKQHKKNAVAMLRLDSPWRMKTPAGYSSYQFPMQYHFNPDFDVPAGAIWTDEYHMINPQLIIKHYGEIKIERGTPLCVYVPYKREPNDSFQYEIKRRDEECEILEGKTLLMSGSKFGGGYKEMQKEKEKETCPYN